MSKYSEEQLHSFFEDATNYIEEEYDKKLVLITDIGPALAISFKSVDDYAGFVITAVNDKKEETVIRLNTADCIDYARNNPDFTIGMPGGYLADSIAFTGLALALLGVGVTPVDHPAVRNAVLDKVLPLVSPVEPDDKEKDGAQTLRSLLLEMLKDLEEVK